MSQMNPDPVFIGIDPTAGRRPIQYAVLDRDLRLRQDPRECQGTLSDVLAAVTAYPSAVCAVDAPMKPNAGQMSAPEIRRRFNLPLNKPTWSEYKVCEYELRRRGLKLYNTPRSQDAAPGWMRLGWQLYWALEQAGFAEHRMGDGAAPRRTFEVHPHACFAVLLGRIPFKKDTLEGRIQRQLVLYREGLRIPDPMDAFEEITRHHLLSGELHLRGLYSHDELDALVAAYTAYLSAMRPDRVTEVGDESEGHIVLPGPLKDKYE